LPNYFGVCSTQKLLDKSGADVSCEFYPDLAFELKKIPGRFIKIGTAPPKEATRVIQLFRQHGICHMTDAGVLLSEGGIITKLIDIQVEYVEPSAELLFSPRPLP